jgi:hypothetical protein
MSQQLNISKKNIEGKCDLKCAYNFNYTNGPVQIENRGFAITLKHEDRNTLPVVYNKKNFRPLSTEILYPSRLLYNDKLADAEISIFHISEDSTQYLYIIIPIKISNDSSSATTEITNVIKSTSTSAPSKGQKLTISNFNLQNIVPKKPFYSFINKVDGNSLNSIAFDMLDAISITNSTFETLKQIIKQANFKVNIDPANFSGLYYNSSGPNTTTSLGDGIYISCNPTGNSTETKEVTYEKNEINYDMYNIFEDPTFILVVQTIIACIVFIIIFYVWNYGYKFIDGDFGDSTSASTKT